ncbi:hypothetical protein GGR50DRAFT_564781 [Xylaria sp. CBS 124048]|nr:hypothetical protein GGR50DRAFT_564781 [Xylaria sp. CBS 124048]
MAPKQQIRAANIQLTYPLYCCDFIDNHRLVVAGGGGPGRNGVGNKLTLLDTSDATQLSEVAELQLSDHEDNVMSLVVVGAQKEKPTTTTILAGVNSSPEDATKGLNKHLRTLALAQPGKSAKTSGVKFSETARDALFVHKDKDTYQRILRLSPPHEGLKSSARLGAVATGLSKHPQIVLFNVPSTNSLRWTTRGRLDPRMEAMDLDVIQTGPDTYQLAYCDDHEVFTVEVSKDGVSDPKSIYTITPEEGETHKAAFKSLRYLTTGFLITVVNNPKSRGVALHGLRLPENDESARLAIRAKLPSSVSKATSLAVRNLSPVASPSDKQGEAQFVIAVAGNDASISLYTLEHKSAFGSDVLADLAPFQVLKSVHPSSITNLAISTFAPPKGSAKSSSSELCVKLASVSVGCSTVVHSIPIKKHVNKSVSAEAGKHPKSMRYIVALKSKGESPVRAIALVSLVFLTLILVGQILLEAKDIGEPILGARKYLPASWTVPLRKVPRVQGPAKDPQKTIDKLISEVNADGSQQLVIKHGDFGAIGPNGLPALHVGIHDEEAHGPATSWENLEKEHQDLWKQRLKETGHWAEDMGESIFSGVLFGEIGGAIGNIVGEAL